MKYFFQYAKHNMVVPLKIIFFYQILYSSSFKKKLSLMKQFSY